MDEVVCGDGASDNLGEARGRLEACIKNGVAPNATAAGLSPPELQKGQLPVIDI